MTRFATAAAAWTLVAAGLVRADDVKTPPETAAADPIAAARAAAESDDGDRAAAAATLRAFLKEHPSDPHAPEARYWLGFCQVRLGENDDALATLRPFESLLTADPFASRALVELGAAYRDTGQNDLALTVWKRVLDDKKSRAVDVRRASLGSIRLLDGTNSDPARCHELCERLLTAAAAADAKGKGDGEGDDESDGLDVKFIGGSCLNLLKRAEAADLWMNRWFDAEKGLDEAKLRILKAQRMLLNAREEDAAKSLDALDADFADLDLDARIDLTVLTVRIPRQSGRADLAGRRITAALENAAIVANENAVERLFDELAAVNTGELHAVLLTTLSAFASDAGRPLAARLVALERLAKLDIEAERAEAAAAVLRDALTRETSEFGRFRIGTRLAEILDDDLEMPAEAHKVLDDLKGSLRRRDLLRQVDEQIADLDAP